MSNEKNAQIAEILFPNIVVEDVISKYPRRINTENKIVTRFGPSPTGFLHIGGLFTALVSERFAHQDGGIFYLRVEDTDQKREVEDGFEGILKSLKSFGVIMDEGPIDENNESGEYGPYLQSKRLHIYHAYIKKLIQLGYAYPCFCTEEELQETRTQQEAEKIRPGYYGKWAKHRECSIEEIQDNISKGKIFVIRLKSDGNIDDKESYIDLIKGKISITPNDQDTILIKSDGFPTYHFAHLVDDYLMGTTHVLRADEWLSSLPLHLQLFRFFGFEAPKYGHISPIMKLDNGTKRKLSKRKDPEAAVSYYHEKGYPKLSVIEYLINIANSSFEDWRKENLTIPYTDFKIELEKFSKSGALFDGNKLNDISKTIIGDMSAQDVFDNLLTWAQEYDNDFAQKIIDTKDYTLQVLNVERGGVKPRKDFACWSEVKENIFYFYSDMFEEYVSNNPIEFPENISQDEIKKVCLEYIENYPIYNGREEWFEHLKGISTKLGYSTNMKEYKENKDSYKGFVSDLATILRVALTTKTQSPDLSEVMRVIGKEETIKRLKNI